MSTFKTKSKKIAFNGVITALAIILSFLESLIPPIPLFPPGAKLGISNVAVMFSAGLTGFSSSLTVALGKSVFVFLTRGVTAGLMSVSGGLLSAVIMNILFHKTQSSLIIIGISGAVTHNMGQLLAASVLTSLPVVPYIPFMVIFGACTGILTSLLLKICMPPLEKVSKHFNII